MTDSNRAIKRAAGTPETWRGVDLSAHLFDTDVGEIRLRHLDIGRGPVILLVHGLGGNWQFWLENILALARRHRVIAVDLPGFGASGCPEGPLQMAGFADALARLLAALDISTSTVVAHSLGGIVAQRFAISHPQFVDGLVLVGSGGLKLKVFRRIGLLLTALSVNAILSNRFFGAVLRRSPALRRAGLGKVVADPSCVSTALLEHMTAGFGSPGFKRAIRAAIREDLRGELSGIRCPTLLVYGTADPLASPTYANALAKLIPGAELVMWEGVGHAPMVERPSEFNRLLEDFVAISAAGAPGA